ncbi:MAG: alpha/beta fold hydrolase [Oscillospiraceae bacterium]|jgi:hypothetical protein|nr:alpha/beta fold hydrolase [Oscillospiraceae bacterium]
MKNIKKLLAVILTAVLLLGTFPFAALAAEEAPVVIVVPGILGSELKDSNDGKLWLPFDPAALVSLTAAAGSLGIDFANITPAQLAAAANLPQVKELIANVTANLTSLAFADGKPQPGITAVTSGYGTADTYKTIVEALGADYDSAFYAYDWRNANADSAAGLAALIDSYKGREITLIGHSMGGLVISEYVKANPETEIANVITLGTPYLGSDAALDSHLEDLLSGSPFGGVIGAFSAQITPAITGLAATLPSLLELQPKESYELPETSANWYAIYGTSAEDGDGTVSTISATNNGKIENSAGFAVDHGALVTDASVLAAIQTIIGGEASEPSEPETSLPTPEGVSDWAVEAVTKALLGGLVPEALQADYQQAITRAEFSALAVTLFEKVSGTELPATAEFKDTDDVNVRKLATLGVIVGIGGGNFAPDASLTREQAAVILVNLAKAAGIAIPEVPTTAADSDSISPWALTQVGQIQAVKVMLEVGNGEFAPKTAYTREQSIATIVNLLGVFGK